MSGPLTPEEPDELNARLCEEQREQYLALSQYDARLKFAATFQGFVASEVERGHPLNDAVHHVIELVAMLCKANGIVLPTGSP